MNQRPCDQCPWRLANQGKRHKFGFYTKKNLRRLWNQIRGGGNAQSCHLTDPSHPDHVAVGAKRGAKVQECPGSLILVQRELRKMAGSDGVVRDESVAAYLKNHRDGLTKLGVLYWAIKRTQLAGVPVIGGPSMPAMDLDNPEIGR
jgi:hypothetical protein